MIQRLRLQFVAVCMLLVTAVLAVVLVSVYSAAQSSTDRVTRTVLERVLRDEESQSTPGLQPGPNLGSGTVQLPFFTVQVWGGNTVYVTGGTYENIEDTDELSDILQDCLGQNAVTGYIASYHLRYLRQDNSLYTKIAFVDTSMEQAALKAMMGAYLQIALAALLLLLAVSLGLSRWVTRPVERAWTQQRQFLSDASHELKTPLTVILSNAELMEASPLEPRQARWADNIHTEARQMKTLVEEMLTLARADNMAPAAVFSDVNLSDVAEDCALLFEPVAFEAGKPLTYELADDIRVVGDRDKLRRLLSVLLDNAIKYGADGGAISLTLQRTERQARLVVSNPGEPIPPAQLSRLFERFYRADASRGEQSGFGLGLAIASAIAEEHKGTLRAESDAVSTRFIFTMPLKK
jgi:signal transduction histidine kinase